LRQTSLVVVVRTTDVVGAVDVGGGIAMVGVVTAGSAEVLVLAGSVGRVTATTRCRLSPPASTAGVTTPATSTSAAAATGTTRRRHHS